MKRLVFLILAVVCSVSRVFDHASDEKCAWHASPLPERESVFVSDPAWRGADGAYSVPLSPTKTLWLYGDTWITPPNARGRANGRMIRNSLAIQTLNADGTGAVKFFWKTGSGHPADAFAPDSGPGWLWPLSGLRIGDSLFLFSDQLIKSKAGLGFASYRSVLLAISNPDDLPERWRTRQVEIPFFHHSEKGDLIFGTASLVQGDFVYVYGVREDWTQGIGGRSLILARTPAGALRRIDFSAWRFYSRGVWVEDLKGASALFPEAGSEMSVSYLASLGKLVAVYTHFANSPEILARLAHRPEGPWEDPVVIYRCPEVGWNKSYFCYAGKAHPELASAANEIIVTYAAGSEDFSDHLRDLRLYWPRCVRVTVDCSTAKAK